MDESEPNTSKGERTKERILQAALELFRELGYEATTMRMVADAAKVSLGNAYYYFASKDLLLQAFYHEVHTAHVAACGPVLAKERGLRERLRGVMLAKLDVIEPYHRFSALMFRSAADPKSPLNPFHAEGAGVRCEGEQVFAEVLSGSKQRIPKDLAAELPNLLWTYSMGVVLFWIHDESPQHARTRRLIERSVELISTSIRLASNPLLRSLRRQALELIKGIKADAL